MGLCMDLLIYNSLTNKEEIFEPIEPDNIRLYVCGPTVYASPHIGNARPLVIFDVLFRLLKTLYQNVTYVRNLTDVDDKINKRAREEGITIRDLTDSVIGEFHANTNKLNLLPVTHEPRATFHIDDMINIIQDLLNNGYAYQADGHVLFRVNRLENYGVLSKRSTEDMIAGSRVEVAPYKEYPMDFVLWKPSDEGMPAWDSPFGKGRPGWHIECSAMSHRYLGKQFDIHAGGQDLIFPHHENEMAQNFGAFGCTMARYWIHNGMLVVNGQKMSKSIGNIVGLDEALSRYDGEVIRYALLSTQYRKTLNWTEQLLQQGTQFLNRLYGAMKRAKNDLRLDDIHYDDGGVQTALCHDLNTPLALQRLHELSNAIYSEEDQDQIDLLCAKLKKSAFLLGLLAKSPAEWFNEGTEISPSEIEELLEKRLIAKREKNYELADSIRKHLLSKNIIIEDTRDGSTWRVDRN